MRKKTEISSLCSHRLNLNCIECLLDRKKGNRPKSLQSGEMDCQKDRNTSSTEIYLLLEDMFSDWQIVLHGDCVCVASSHLRRSCGIVVVLIEIVLFRYRPSWQLDVHIQIILWFVSVDPVLCYSLIDHYSSLERRKVGEIKKGKGYQMRQYV